MSGETLFDSAAADRLRERAPLAARIRPRSLDEVVGQEHLVGVGRPLRLLVERDALTSVLFWGPPGTGKTTLAEVVALTTSRHFVRLSAVSSGVKEVREAIEGARERLGISGQSTIVFIDEIHRFSRSQQDALLPAVENGTITLIGATTENPMFEVNSPLRSRSTLFRLEPLSRTAVTALLHRGLHALGQDAEFGAIELIATRCVGDGRAALTALDVASAIAGGGCITLLAAEAALSTSAQRYGQDDHYDVISAFIKSIRASQVDAAIHWLARMLEAGEDPRFIARRLIILASEDIGLADSQSLVIAVAAAHALEHVGLPEAQLNLAQAVIHLCRAPKSNAVAQAIWTAREDIRHGRVGEVPAHLRDAHYLGASQLGHGDGYISPHDDPSAAEHLTCVPEELRGQRYYREGQ
ncbi:MAG: replication-associated recombination protein A [Actinobacteria bacterium]|nr:replication-associated recombination protein A [Actinomycetota bacterium]